MKKTLLAITTGITAVAASTSLYLATLPNPTETQKNFANTTNTIAIAGTTAIFGMLDDQNQGDRNDTQKPDDE